MVDGDKAETKDSKEDVWISPVLHAGETELVVIRSDEQQNRTTIGEEAIIDVEVVAFVRNLHKDQNSVRKWSCSFKSLPRLIDHRSREFHHKQDSS